MSADETLVIERMEGPFNNVLWAARLNSEDAANFERGAVQAFELLAAWSNGKATAESGHMKGVSSTILKLPKESPFQPAIARLDDIVLLSTNVGLLRNSVEQLQDKSAKSKFDDPRLQAALAELHKPDDSLVFFDAKQFFQGLHGVGEFIRAHAKGDPKAIRVTDILDRVIDETAILDYAITVEYTEPGQNHSVSLMKMADGYQTKLLGRALANDQPIEDWKKWVPADATAYSIHQGMNLHELYDGVIKLVREQVPESQTALEKFSEFQNKIGVNFDNDILQSFTGESACVTVPITLADGSKSEASVTALKCQHPDKIRELLGRAVDALNKFPAAQMQQLKLEDCKLEGFQQVHAAAFQMFGIQPVFGFRDGWMFISCYPEGIEKVLAVRAGKAEAVDVAAMFTKFGIDPKLAMCDVTYKNTGACVRQIADMIDKIGVMTPMFLIMAAANAKPEEIKPLQEIAGLLPSVAKMVRKFDFYGHSLIVTRQGPMPGSYLKESVTEIRPPKGS
jgi:hypothetical protein